MSVQLSSGALKAITEGAQIDKPVFQLLALKKLNQTATTNNAPDRYRILLSDGINNNAAMLAVQLNQMVMDGQLEPNTVICLDRYVCNSLAGNRRVVIILELTVVASASQAGGKIGNPVALNPGSGGASTNGQQAPVPQRPPPQMQQMRPAASPMSVAKANSFPGAGNFNKQPQGNFGGAGPSSGMSPPKKAQPISSLTPYQNRWTIKARVSSKSDVRTWSNSRGEGKLFSMDLCDQSGEIRATAFKEQCDKFFDLIEVGKVYYISRGTLKTANRQYTSITNDYEMTFNNDTSVIPSEEEDDSIPTMQFDFRSINQLEDINKDAILEDTGEDSVGEDTVPPVTKPTATVTPVAAVAPTTSGQTTTMQPAAVAPAHPMAFIRPVSEGGTGSQVSPGFPIYAPQRFPMPGTAQQTFPVRGAAPVISVVHHHHPMPGPRGPPPAGASNTTSTVTGATSTTPVVTGSGQAFQIHFYHRPGYPPQPVVRVIQNPPPPPPGVNRCTHAHHGHPVFRTPTPATVAQPNPAVNQTQTSSTPTPTPHAPPQAASVQTPRRPESVERSKPELAELAQRIRNISADVKTIKPGSKGVPLDPRERQRRDAAEAMSVRRKEVKAKSRAPQTQNATAVARDPSTHVMESASASTDKTAPADEATGSSSGDASHRRKRRKRAKLPSPSLEEAEQDNAADPALEENKTSSVPGKEELGTGDVKLHGRADESMTHSDPKPVESSQEMKPETKYNNEQKSVSDSDNDSESESDEESNSDVNSKEATEQNLMRDSSSGPVSSTASKPLSPEEALDPGHEVQLTDSTKVDSELASKSSLNLGSEPTEGVSSSSTEGQTESITGESSLTELEEQKAEAPTLMQSMSMTSAEPEADFKSDTDTNISPDFQDDKTHLSSLQTSQKDKETKEMHPVETAQEAADVKPKLNQDGGKKEDGIEAVADSRPEDEATPESVTPQETPSGAALESSPTDKSQRAAEKNLGSIDALQSNTKSKTKSNEMERAACVTGTILGTDKVPDAQSNILSESTFQTVSDQIPSKEPRIHSSAAPSSGLHDQQEHYSELQRDHLDLERRQLVLERKRLECERQQLLLKEERLQIEQDRLQAERERLHALQEQVKLQRDQLELDQNRLDLERDHLEVDHDRLQVERQRLQQEELRGEESKMILRSLQEISQTLQISVSLSSQQYGFPVSYNSEDAEQYMQQETDMQPGVQEDWLAEEISRLEGGAFGAEGSQFEGQPSEDAEEEWTVVGGTRASLNQHQRTQARLQGEAAATSQGATDSSYQTMQSGLSSEQTAPSSSRRSSSSYDEAAQSRATGDPSKGQKSVSGQRSAEGRSLSPVHGLSSIEGRQGNRQNPNRREHRQGRPDSRRGRNTDRRRWKPDNPKTESK